MGVMNALEIAAAGGAIPVKPLVALLGDSYAEQNSFAGTVSGYSRRGALAWANIHGGQRYDCPLSLNFGVSGEGLASIKTRVALVIAAAPRFCVIFGGTNNLASVVDDATAETVFQSMISDMRDGILLPLAFAGIIPVPVPIAPRGGLTALQQRTRARYNNWLREVCRGRSDLIGSLPFTPLYVESNRYLQNLNSASQAAVSGMFYPDGVHLGRGGAWWVGYAINETLSRLVPPVPKIVGADDVYDAVSNKNGNHVQFGGVSKGNFNGTSGLLTTSTGLTPTGSLASSWEALRNGGSSTATMVLAKENPRTDGPNSGERQRVTINVTGAGAASETYMLRINGIGSFTPGDQVYAEVNYEVMSAPNNYLGVGLSFSEIGPASPRTASDCANDVADTASLIPAVPMKGSLRTPAIVIQSGIVSVNLNITAALKTDGGSASLDLMLSDCAVRKVV